MKYIVNQEQFDKIIKHYFDKRFENAVLKTEKLDEDGGNRWTGFWVREGKNEILLLGHPEFPTDPEMWFSNGQIFDGWVYFDIEPNEFYRAMERYLEKKYGLVLKIT